MKADRKKRTLRLHVRSRIERTRDGKEYDSEPAKALCEALKSDVGGLTEPVVEWKGMDLAVAVDIDCPTDEQPLAAHQSVEEFFPVRLPQPLAAWRTHGGGLRAVFTAVGHSSAFRLASAWYHLAPLGRLVGWKVEMLTHTRHPKGTRSGGERCGPVVWFVPKGTLRVPTGRTRLEATKQRIEDFMAETGLRPGRYSTAACPVPGCGMRRATSGSDPIEVDLERGIHCYRCRRHARWAEVLDSNDPGRTVDSAGIREAARQLVHFSHQRHVLAALRPQATDRMQKAAWSAILRSVNESRLKKKGDEEWEKKVSRAEGSAVKVVRGRGNTWLQAGTLEQRSKFTASSARLLPWCHQLGRIEEAQDSVALAGFTPVVPLAASAILGPYSKAPPGTVYARRARRPGEPARPPCSKRPQHQEVEGAWRVLKEALPGLNMDYVSGLIAAVLFAQRAVGTPPMLVVTGPSGSGKTATQHLVGAAIGAPAVSVSLADPQVTLREVGTALEEGAGLLFVDEVGRTPGTYRALQAPLKLNSDVRFEAKYANPKTIAVNAPLSIIGSTLTPEILRAPELARRSVAYFCEGQNPGWDRNGDLSRARRGQLRSSLDTIVASIWWMVRDAGPHASWKPLTMQVFGGSEVSELDSEDPGGEVRSESIRQLYELFRGAKAEELTRDSGHAGWLPLTPGTPAWGLAERLVDFSPAATERRATAAQIADLKRTPLGPALGFTTPSLKLHVGKRGGSWRLAFRPAGVMKGRGPRRGEFPASIPRRDRPDPRALRTAKSAKNSTMSPLRTVDLAKKVESCTLEDGGSSESIRTSPCSDSAGCQEGLVSLSFGVESPLDLRRVGGPAYAAGLGTRILRAVALLPCGGVMEWTCGSPAPQALVDAVHAGATVVSYNWSTRDRFLWQVLQWPDPVEAADASRLARLAGLPGGAEAARAALGHATDAAVVQGGSARGEGALGARDCLREASTAALVYSHAQPLVTPEERSVLAAHDAINDRGFGFDVELARGVVEAEGLLVRAASGAADRDLRSPKKFRARLRRLGYDLPDVRRRTLELLLAKGGVPDPVRAAIRARLTLGRATSRTLAAGLEAVDGDGRLRGVFRYHGAHTGRWSTRGFQAHNLPRGVPVDVEAAVEAAQHVDMPALGNVSRDADCSPSDVLASLVRRCVVPSPGRLLAIFDYKAIEARGLAWLASDEPALTMFRGGEDPYASIAAELFAAVPGDADSQRQLGKIAELGCGYQMGADRFERYAEAQGVDWSTCPLTARNVVDGWRKRHPAVSGPDGLWHKLEAAFWEVTQGKATAHVGQLEIKRRQDDILVRLPSGRSLVYSEVRIEKTTTPWGEQQDTPTCRRRGNRVAIYGGLLAENVVQALCRDVLAGALVTLEEADFDVVLHVHDEVVIEVDTPGAVDAIRKLVTEPPEWAPGLPLDVSIHTSKRYCK